MSIIIISIIIITEREREMFYLTTHSTHFIYGYMASDIWLRIILIVRKETRCCHIGYSYRLTARVLLYAPSHRQDNTYHSLCCTSRGALAGTRNSSVGPLHEGSIRRPIAPWANALPLSYVPLPIIIRLPLVNPILSLYCIILHAPHMLMVNGLNCNNILWVVPQSDLSSTIIVSRCYNDLNFFLRLTACSTKRPYLTVIVG